MKSVKNWITENRPVCILVGIILLLTTIPAINTSVVLGEEWGGIMPTFTDETFYQARVQTIVKGYPTVGNPYFIEHASGAPLVLFAGTWINALPQLFGLSLNASLYLNFIIWSILFALSLYWLFRTLRTKQWVAVVGTVFLYVQSFAHVWRPVNLQPVYPIIFLFYIALVKFLLEPKKSNIIFLGVITGVTFYFYAYLWQTALITLGLVFLYALFRSQWILARAATYAAALGVSIGLPIPLYALWLSNASPYFWESVGRLGLVNTHIPMAEIIYSGGLVFLVLLGIGLLLWSTPDFRNDRESSELFIFVAISGLGLWVMQGSNLITGKLLETGEHLRLLIWHWLAIITFTTAGLLWCRRAFLSDGKRVFAIVLLIFLMGVSIFNTYERILPFIPSYTDQRAWRLQQLYAKPFAWLEANESTPSVVWSDPHNFLLSNILPIHTKHFSLYAYFGMLELVPEGEIRERYLVSQYFDVPTPEKLKSVSEMELYLGRSDMFHAVQTIERKVKICRLIFFYDKNKNCGTVPTLHQYVGEQTFIDMHKKFEEDIKPNINSYLKKYNVTFILKDKVLDSNYRPELLGGVLVYSDERFEIYRLPKI